MFGIFELASKYIFCDVLDMTQFCDIMFTYAEGEEEELKKKIGGLMYINRALGYVHSPGHTQQPLSHTLH